MAVAQPAITDLTIRQLGSHPMACQLGTWLLGGLIRLRRYIAVVRIKLFS